MNIKKIMDAKTALRDYQARAGEIVHKDWERMLDLVVMGKEGANIAEKIKDKPKAIARFICGLKLLGEEIDAHGESFRGVFSEFGDRALALGATVEEVEDLFNRTTVPEEFKEKLENSKGKKLQDRFVGPLVKKLMDAGYKVNFKKHNGNALTNEGRYAMERNGRKWTIGYKMEITAGEKVVDFEFDAITDEGGGPTVFYANQWGKCNGTELWNNLFKMLEEYKSK